MIEGYCTRRSYRGGEQIDVHVSTDAPSFELTAIRSGKSPAAVFHQEKILGHFHPMPGDAVENGCGWPVGFSFEAGPLWKSGFYRLLLVTPTGEQAEAFFVLRARVPSSSILWVIETNTWNAYNFYGGANTYAKDGDAYAQGAPRVSFQRPLPKGFLSLPGDAARVPTVGVTDTSLPYLAWALEHGLSIWTGAVSWDHRGSKFAKWIETENIEVDYAVNSDLEEFPDILAGYRLMLSVGHDEYWSWAMRDTVESFVARGRNVAFFSGNTCFWQVRFERSGQQMVAYKNNFAADPVLGTAEQRMVSGMWSNPLTKRPENLLTGLSFARGGYARVAGATPGSAGGYTVYRAKHWTLAGSGLGFGDQLGAASSLIGYECDGCDFQFTRGLPYPTGRDGTPENFEIIAIAPATLWSHETAPAFLYPQGTLSDVEQVSMQLEGNTAPETIERFVHGHAVMGCYTMSGGGTVFNAGTTEWVYGLGETPVAVITRNVIDRLSSDTGDN